MEKLANLTQTDINNGVLNRMLANAGIPNVQEYVKVFHQETEELIIEELEHSDSNKTNNDDEQIVPPIDIQSWISALRPRLDDPIKPPQLEEKQPQPQPQLPTDVQSWITGLRLRLDDPTQLPSLEKSQEQRKLPTDLTSWLKSTAPIHLHSSIDTTTTVETTTSSTEESAVTGNLGAWLNDWSKSLTEQPPPTSLDNWLQSLVSKDMHEPIGKAANPKGRLNTYLNAAQEVLSQHGYNVTNEFASPTSVAAKAGKFGNVKQMYFLWKVLDKNNDRKITVEDVQIMLQEMGLGFLSKSLAETVFNMVDSNHDGTLQFRDFIAMMGIIKQLISTVGSAKTKV